MTPSPSRVDASRRRWLLGLAAAAWAGTAGAQSVKAWPAQRGLPDLNLPLLGGGQFALKSQRGVPLLLNFWASWCEPCRDEMPSLELLAQRHAADGLQVLAVNYQEAERTVRRFVGDTGLSLPVALDLDGAATKAWTSRVFPSTVLVGRDGRPRLLVMGEADWSGPAARQWMDDLLKQRT
ncbi:thiol-disulfide isomerase-like thioredoxin [Burkholderiales bacterium JOSHI_001]|nr:thiol-disulfide isomerase-like thioredoxin [Burkholderiales bacterium JOSHI_001]